MQIAFLAHNLHHAAVLSAWLIEAGYLCKLFASRTAYLQAIAAQPFDLHILQRRGTDQQDIRVLRAVRAHLDQAAPLMYVAGRSSEAGVVRAFASGADECLCQPLRQKETLARVMALGRRSAAQAKEQGIVRFSPYLFRAGQHQIEHNGKRLGINYKEFELALYLFRHPDVMLSRERLLSAVWGKGPALNTRTVDTHMSRVRRLLNLVDGATGWQLFTIHGQGYLLHRVPG